MPNFDANVTARANLLERYIAALTSTPASGLNPHFKPQALQCLERVKRATASAAAAPPRVVAADIDRGGIDALSAELGAAANASSLLTHSSSRHAAKPLCYGVSRESLAALRAFLQTDYDAPRRSEGRRRPLGHAPRPAGLAATTLEAARSGPL